MNKSDISVVIICLNSVSTIERAIQTSLDLSNDVIVIDSGSNDGTLGKISSTSAKLINVKWNGYGDAKNKGIEAASNTWIFSLDADEYLDDELIQSLHKFFPKDLTEIGTVKRLSYLSKKPILFGEWKNDMVIRFFHKNQARWDTSPVHENLVFRNECKQVKLKGFLHHYTSPDINSYKLKLEKYALLMANKYYQKGKRAYWHKIYLSPVFYFFKNYFLRAGFLDGKEGLEIAAANAEYSYRKYKLLQQKWKIAN